MNPVKPEPWNHFQFFLKFKWIEKKLSINLHVWVMICIIFATFGIFVQLLDKNSLIVWFYASGFSETKSYYHTNDAEISKTHVSNMIQV